MVKSLQLDIPCRNVRPRCCGRAPQSWPPPEGGTAVAAQSCEAPPAQARPGRFRPGSENGKSWDKSWDIWKGPPNRWFIDL